MKWLPKEKRNPLIIVVLITATVLALICFGLIHSQNTTLSQVADSRKDAGNKLQDIERTIKNADLTAHELDDVTYSLSRAEEDMATGDYYSWTYNTMSLFKNLHACHTGGGRLDARVRTDRGHPFGGVRRIRGGRACRPNSRLPAQGDVGRLLWNRGESCRALHAGDRRGP